jgi:hypothetical protein
MANDPPFAILNHFAGDLGIPRESDSLRIGINDLLGPRTVPVISIPLALGRITASAVRWADGPSRKVAYYSLLARNIDEVIE